MENNYCPNAGTLRSATPEELASGSPKRVPDVPACGRIEGQPDHAADIRRLGPPQIDGRHVRIPMKCGDCGTLWMAVYVYSGPEDIQLA